MATLRTVIAMLAVAALLGLAFVYGGIFNVAATAGHSRPVAWLLHTAMERSVQARAVEIEVPEHLDRPESIAAGALHYEDYCAICHLSPVRSDSALFRGLTPAPPRLADHHHWGPAELYWITYHGIKMTGMPAWSERLSEAQIWETVAFMQVLPELDAEAYRQLQRAGAD